MGFVSYFRVGLFGGLGSFLFFGEGVVRFSIVCESSYSGGCLVWICWRGIILVSG